MSECYLTQLHYNIITLVIGTVIRNGIYLGGEYLNSSNSRTAVTSGWKLPINIPLTAVSKL